MYYSLISSMSKFIFVYDADALAFITAAAITDNTQKLAINTLVISLKSYGLWSKMKALYPFVGGNATSHKFNLKDPRDLNVAFRLTFGGGWTHSSNGVLPNGTNAFANTNLIPLTSLPNQNSHFSYYSKSNISTAGITDNGCQSVNNQFYNVYYATSTQSIISIQNNDANRIFFNESNSLGLIIGSRTSSTSLKGYRNSILKGTNTTNSTVILPDINVYIGSFLYKSGANVFTTFYGVRECAFSSIGSGLTDTEAANLYSSVQAFQTTLGRQV